MLKLRFLLYLICLVIVFFCDLAFASGINDDVFAELFDPIIDILENTILKAASIAAIIIFASMLMLDMIERSVMKTLARIIIAIAIGYNGADFILSLVGGGFVI